MSNQKPDCIVQGERARLFPVLSTTSKEGRTTSIVLACMAKIDELGASLLASVGQKVGVRSKIETYTEVVCANRPNNLKDRPDGLIVVKTGSREWRALVEAKVGANDLDADQIEKYRQLAKENQIDCLITVSNQFATNPNLHPLPEVQKSRSKIPVYHWSWMYVLTEADLLLTRESVADVDQRILLNELRRFLSHESAGVKGFDRMPKEWADLNKLVSSGGVIPARSTDAATVVMAWHQETRDLTLILSRLTEANVSEKLSRKYAKDGSQRAKDELVVLRETNQLVASFEIPDAAATLDVIADITRRTVDIGMTLRAPEDKVSTKARVNWLLRQVKNAPPDDLHIRLLWPGRNEPTQHPIQDLRDNPDAASEGKEHLSPHSFHIFHSKRLGARFTQQTNFITDLETCVPAFYGEVGSNLVAWKKAAPKIKPDRPTAEDVSASSLSDDASEFDPEG